METDAEKIIYLDNSATTKPCDEAINACINVLKNEYGNPSSIHLLGNSAAAVLNNSRNIIYSALLGNEVRSLLPRNAALIPRSAPSYGRLIFTGSGTEADNLAVFGSVEKYCDKASKYKIITTDSEHPAIKEPFEKLKNLGFNTVYISTKNGILNLEQLRSELTPNTVLLSIMLANNETGAIYDVKTAFKMAHEISKDVVCHTDAIQAFQKMPFTAKSIGADMISVSAHKVRAPKGVGALWVSGELVKRNRISPQILGGGQEEGYRSGTENLAGIAAFAAAIEANGGAESGSRFYSKCEKLREVLLSELPDGITENRPQGAYLPHIVNLTLRIPKSQPILNYMSARNICISAGSACSSKKTMVSSALLAFGLTKEQAASTIRVSFGEQTTEEEIRSFNHALSEGLSTLYGKKN